MTILDMFELPGSRRERLNRIFGESAEDKLISIGVENSLICQQYILSKSEASGSSSSCVARTYSMKGSVSGRVWPSKEFSGAGELPLTLIMKGRFYQRDAGRRLLSLNVHSDC